MDWLKKINSERVYVYTKDTDTKVEFSGTQDEFKAIGVEATCEHGDEFMYRDIVWVYTRFEPVKMGGLCTRIGGNGSDREIASMQKSFRERFMKVEADDVREKHGASFDESLRAGDIKRRMSGD